MVRVATTCALVIITAAAFSPSFPCNGRNAFTRNRQLNPAPATETYDDKLQLSLRPVPVNLHALHASDNAISDLCSLLDIDARAAPRQNDAGIRGMYPVSDGGRSSVTKEGEVVLSVPLSSCLRDDMPPGWLSSAFPDYDDGFDDADEDEDNNEYYASQWATRLAASLLDLKLQCNHTSTANQNDNAKSKKYKQGMQQWLSMLPNANTLRASLPIHWSPDILQSTKCQALELAVDSAYFARANSVADLIEALDTMYADLEPSTDIEPNKDTLPALCNDALDIVQTRTCRVMDKDNNMAPLRILAPVFDFLNHGTNPNAGFALESDLLVVRATRDIAPTEEILIDYGESSTVPAWRCLTSYGFLIDFIEGDERNAVEILVDGVRANVGGDSVPFEVVEAAAICLAEEDGRALEEGENIFTPPVALRIADIASEKAQQLLSKSRDLNLATEEDTHSLNLATALRLSQHKALTSWSAGLREYAHSQQC